MGPMRSTEGNPIYTICWDLLSADGEDCIGALDCGYIMQESCVNQQHVCLSLAMAYWRETSSPKVAIR